MLLPSPVWPLPVYLNSWYHILGSYEISLLTALEFTSTTRHVHSWASLPLWPSLFILSAAISLLLPSGILYTFWPGGLIFRCHIFLPFLSAHGVLKVRILEWFAISSSSGPCFIRAFHHDRLPWVALHSMAYNFIESHKPLHHDKVVIHEQGPY